MARRRPADGFARLLDAGLAVFARKGLKATRMSDVAREMGVSPGTLYGYVESKEALFWVLVDRGLDEDPPALPEVLPIKTPEWSRVLGRLREQVHNEIWLPSLAGALKDLTVEPEDPAAELEHVVGELYDLYTRTRLWTDVLEASSPSVPDLSDLYYGEVRRRILGKLNAYLGARIGSGALHSEVAPLQVALFVAETVTLFARRRHRFLMGPAWGFSEEQVRDGCVRLVCDGLVRPS